MTALIVTLAGSLGAVARYFVAGAIQNRTRSRMPVGTAAVNLIGAFALGVLAGVGQTPTGWLLAGAGFTAGFTTFSTWMVETARLGLLPRPSMRSIANLVLVAAAGVLCAALGYYLMR